MKHIIYDSNNVAIVEIEGVIPETTTPETTPTVYTANQKDVKITLKVNGATSATISREDATKLTQLINSGIL